MPTREQSRQHRIVITGFMGSGKNTVGRALAASLNCSFVDLDQQITKIEGRTANEIIRNDGEAVFRKIETQILRELLASGSTGVIALGGGTWTVAENRQLI